jgi:hypothetical protein
MVMAARLTEADRGADPVDHGGGASAGALGTGGEEPLQLRRIGHERPVGDPGRSEGRISSPTSSSLTSP